MEYKKEAFSMFEEMMQIISDESLRIIFSFTPVKEEEEISRMPKARFRLKVFLLTGKKHKK